MRSALAQSAAARVAASARSPSAFVTSTRSASSMMPRLIPCRSSPPPGDNSSTNRSVMSATATSAWPTPTVSTSTRSKPAASHSAILSRVRLATPPSVVPAGDGRTNARGCRASSVMRVLSPRIEPPLSEELGSTASTARRRPRASAASPSASMRLDLPTPGAPDMPTRRLRPASGARRSSNASASHLCSARVDSTRVMARASALRCPCRRPSSSAALLIRTRGSSGPRPGSRRRRHARP